MFLWKILFAISKFRFIKANQYKSPLIPGYLYGKLSINADVSVDLLNQKNDAHVQPSKKNLKYESLCSSLKNFAISSRFKTN
jgi:hypothetical protein